MQSVSPSIELLVRHKFLNGQNPRVLVAGIPLRRLRLDHSDSGQEKLSRLP